MSEKRKLFAFNVYGVAHVFGMWSLLIARWIYERI